MNTIPTLEEFQADSERAAIARVLCRRGDARFPSASDVATEVRLMFHEAVRGERVEPRPTRADAEAWLRAHKLAVPAREVPPQGDFSVLEGAAQR